MPQNVYECMFLLDTNKVSGDVAAAEKQLHGILERNHAEILASRQWDDRRLAYPVKNHKKGLYYLIYFRSEGKSLTGIEHDCALNEMVLRQLTLRIDPKHVDTMLAIAKDEHATAFHNITQEPTDSGLPEDDMMGDRPRRRRQD